MKAMKGKILKKLKTVKQIGYLKPDRILQVRAADGYVSSDSMISKNVQLMPISNYDEPTKILFDNQEAEVIDAVELMKDLDELDQEMGFSDKENTNPKSKENRDLLRAGDSIDGELKSGSCGKARDSIDVSSFRRPDLDSSTLFDPNLLAAFQQAVMAVKAEEAEVISRIRAKVDEEEPPLKTRRTEETEEETPNPLLNFEEKCPPGGDDSVVLYTTGLRGIRKTFEDCRAVQRLLEQFKILFYERDISMHSEYKEELWETLGGKCLPPKLFIKGRYIGGAEEVLTLHEQGRLKPMFEGIPLDLNQGFCEGCGGVRFIMCFKCNGSRKITNEDRELDDDTDVQQPSKFCRQCNENGLLICPYCC